MSRIEVADSSTIVNIHQAEGITAENVSTFQIPTDDVPTYEEACSIGKIPFMVLSRSKGERFLTGKFAVEKIHPDREHHAYAYVTKTKIEEVKEGMVAVSIDATRGQEIDLATTLTRVRLQKKYPTRRFFWM